MPSNSAVYGRRAIVAQRFEPRPGEHVVRHFDSDMTPCGCVAYCYQGVPCTPVAWLLLVGPSGRRYRLRCLMCRATWTRAALARSSANALELDASHPEERERAAARRKERLANLRSIGFGDVAISAGGAASVAVQSGRPRAHRRAR